MKTTKLLKVSFVGMVISNLLITVSGTQTAGAGELTKKLSIYDKKKVKGRAKRGYTNNGTEIYSYTTIQSWDDSLSTLQAEDAPVDLLGNVEVKDGVRKVHNITIVEDSINSQLDVLEIGNVDVSNDTDQIENTVEIEGELNPENEAKIGVVTLSDGESKQINNQVKVGSINTKGKRVTIGGVNLANGKATKITSKITIGGNNESTKK